MSQLRQKSANGSKARSGGARLADSRRLSKIFNWVQFADATPTSVTSSSRKRSGSPRKRYRLAPWLASRPRRKRTSLAVEFGASACALPQVLRSLSGICIQPPPTFKRPTTGRERGLAPETRSAVARLCFVGGVVGAPERSEARSKAEGSAFGTRASALAADLAPLAEARRTRHRVDIVTPTRREPTSDGLSD